MYVEAPRLLRPYLGQSEAAVREVFAEARVLSPAVVILDQLDAIAARRSLTSQDSCGAASVGTRVLSTLLNEMDGVAGRGGHVLIIGCVKDSSALDGALLRPGRFDEVIRLDPPCAAVREQLLRFSLRHTPLSPTVNFARVAGDPMEGSPGERVQGKG